MLTATERKNIAETIFKHLGGNRFIAMTGARNFAFATNGGLTFALPPKNPKYIKHVRIDLNASDFYDVTFFGRCMKTEVVTDVNCEQLQEVFTNHTCLRTSL